MTDKEHYISTSTQRNIFKRKLGITLLLWFLALSIIPLTIISIVSYMQADRNLHDAASKALSSTAKLKTDFIENWYSYRLKDLKSQASDPTNIRFLEELKKAFKAGGKDLAGFVGSEEWKSIVEDSGGDFINFKNTYGYYDVFLIDDDANILFTVAEEDDLGTNLRIGEYKETRFARACLEACETKRQVFSDLEFYAPSAYDLAGFVVQSMEDEDGNKIGVMAFQIELDKINNLLRERTGLGKTGETYLVGKDLLLRSDPETGKKTAILNENEKVETELTRTWHDKLFSQEYKDYIEKETKGGEYFQYMFTDTKEYVGRKGVPVLGYINHLEIAGVPMAVVAEIEQKEAFASVYRLRIIVFSLFLTTIVLVAVIAYIISRRIVSPIQKLSAGAEYVAEGHLGKEIEVKSGSEIGVLVNSFNDMIYNLRQTRKKNEANDWLKTGQTELNEIMRGEHNIETLCNDTIKYVAEYLKAQIGALYVANEEGRLKLISSYAYTRRKNLSNEFMPGEGLVGQAAVEKKHILIINCPKDYVSIYSGLGESIPKNILVYPIQMENTVKGVVELGTFHEFSDSDFTFLGQVSEGIAIALNSVESRKRMVALLEKTQGQAEELQTQQEELRASNEELETQTRVLEESKSRLQEQQEELKATNEELEEKTERLEDQKHDIETKNRELKRVQKIVEEKARDLEMSGKYKSEFLANMSHELRTPLNSILLLSRHLIDNKDGSMTEDHMESAKSIHSSGSDLLDLINEVLDISKVEAGKMELHIGDMDLRGFTSAMKRNFQPIATEKSLSLNVNIEDGLPAYINTDHQRVEQIVKNFLSNAFKFTAEGGVTLSISRPGCLKHVEVDLQKKGFDPAKIVAISVTDTGMGIPEEKQKLIFEAFQQADGTTSRKYGGTGLGLSIARELAILLGGEICMESVRGKGSTFMLCLPETFESGLETGNRKLETKDAEPESLTIQQKVSAKRKDVLEDVEDDRKMITPEDKSILIIEDDPTFLKILRDLTREHGFKCLVAADGETGLQFADYYKPSAIILDIGLPGINGWAVMARLKDNPETRHIPVHFISAADKKSDALRMGAVDYLTKPVSPEVLGHMYKKLNKIISKSVKELLVVEDNKDQAKSIAKILGNGDIRITIALTAEEAHNQLLSGKFDCMILDLRLPDISGIELLKKIKSNEDLTHIPIIVYTGKELTKRERAVIDEYAESTIIKGVDSHQRLLDEATLFLHRVEADLPEEQQKMLRMMHDKEKVLADKKILVVDDDMRNVFSLKKILEDKGIRVLAAKNGKECLERMNNNPDINLVLMDIMMPEMDGYEAMGEIRKQKRFKNLPIIALTAKAMKGDRTKCIEAGASDYLAKPVDTDRLFSVLRVWLY